jgi:hypothetical protein
VRNRDVLQIPGRVTLNEAGNIQEIALNERHLYRLFGYSAVGATAKGVGKPHLALNHAFIHYWRLEGKHVADFFR